MPTHRWVPLLLAFTLPQAPAPTATTPTSYDIISIHDHDPGAHNNFWRSTPDGMTMTGIPLRSLASGAYGIKLDLVAGGPAWVTDKGFDITAKLLPDNDGQPVKLTDDQRQLLFQSLLADRFHLKAHIEVKTLPIYDLVIAKGGLKIQPLPPTPPEQAGDPKKTKLMTMIYPNRIVARSYAFSGLATQLGYMVHQTVIDKTGISGLYDFTLEFTPDDVLARAPNDPAASGATTLKPDIFTALQEQLGLRLVPTKGPVRTLVIDHAELPTPN